MTGMMLIGPAWGQKDNVKQYSAIIYTQADLFLALLIFHGFPNGHVALCRFFPNL